MTKQRLGKAAMLLAMIASCGNAPAAPACLDIEAGIDKAEAVRREALDKQATAWKLVVPFAVAARHISASNALGEADRQLSVLRERRSQEGCGDAPVLVAAPLPVSTVTVAPDPAIEE